MTPDIMHHLPVTSTRPAHLSIRHPSEMIYRKDTLVDLPTLPITPSTSDRASGLGPNPAGLASSSSTYHTQAPSHGVPILEADRIPYEDEYDSPTAEEVERENKYPNLRNGQLYITSLSAFAMYFHPVEGCAREKVSEERATASVQRRESGIGGDDLEMEDLHAESSFAGDENDGDQDDRIGEEVYHLILDIRFVIGSDEWQAYEESCRDLGSGRGGRSVGAAEKSELQRKGSGTTKHMRSEGRGSADRLSRTASSSNAPTVSPATSNLPATHDISPALHSTPHRLIYLPPHRPIYLPNVYKITLFGAEHVEESLTRAEAIGEIIASCGQTTSSVRYRDQQERVREKEREHERMLQEEEEHGYGRGRRQSGGLGMHCMANQSRRHSHADVLAHPMDIDPTDPDHDTFHDIPYPYSSSLSDTLSPKSGPSHSAGGGGGYSAWGSGSRLESFTGSAFPFGRSALGGFGGGFTGLPKSGGRGGEGKANEMVHEKKTGLLDPGWREVAMYSEESRGPMEVEWLTSIDVPLSTLTFATHLIHPAIIQAGKKWGQLGCLRKMAVRGGFPILIKVEDPNASAEDAWAASKPDYCFAFKDWISGNGLEILIWSFLGAYTESSTNGILKRLFDVLQLGFNSAHRLCQTLIMEDLAPVVREKLLAKDSTNMYRLGLSKASVPFLQWLEDIILIEVRDEGSGHVDMNRLWDTELSEEGEDKQRVLRRFKSDMLANDHRTKRHPGLKARTGTMSIQEQCESLRLDVGSPPPPPRIDPGTPVSIMTPPLDPSHPPSLLDVTPMPSRTASCVFSTSTSTASLITYQGETTSGHPSPVIVRNQLSPELEDDGLAVRPTLQGRRSSSMLEMRKVLQKPSTEPLSGGATLR